ncbi:MAG TPA: hypothetical protein VI168_19280 [Croceibacterium sp.]
MFTLTELEGPDGGEPRTLSFVNAQVQPLDFATLQRARLNQRLTIPLVWRGGTLVGTTIKGQEPGETINASATLESRFTSQAIGLVKGGWLPSAFAVMHQKTTILIDRNVVSKIVSRFENGRRRGRHPPDFIDLFADQPIRINPLLFVLEGNNRSIPTPSEAAAQLEEVERKLRAALPQAELVIGPDSLLGALGLIEDSRASLERKQHFLRCIAPCMVSPVARRDVEARWNDVVLAADLYGVPRQSLVVLAALSAVAVPNGKSPAKNLLKFRNGYTEAEAYNALADLRAIELFIGCHCLFPSEPMQICTADKPMALVWTGIQASNFRWIGTGFSYDMTPVEGLFPESVGLSWQSILEKGN